LALPAGRHSNVAQIINELAASLKPVVFARRADARFHLQGRQGGRNSGRSAYLDDGNDGRGPTLRASSSARNFDVASSWTSVLQDTRGTDDFSAAFWTGASPANGNHAGIEGLVRTTPPRAPAAIAEACLRSTGRRTVLSFPDPRDSVSYTIVPWASSSLASTIALTRPRLHRAIRCAQLWSWLILKTNGRGA
jgi:hypothetical protein